MHNAEQQELTKLLAVTAEVCGASLSPAAAESMVAELVPYSLPSVAAALRRCQRDLQGRLPLAAILERLDDGHPGPEEAWAMYPKSEDDTALVTDEIMAAGTVATALIDEGDLVAARMAFLEVYRQRLAQARLEHRQARWWVTLGMDPRGRVAVLTQGVEQGKIAASHALHCAGGQHDAVVAALTLLPGAKQLGIAPPFSAEDVQVLLESLNNALEAQGAAPLAFGRETSQVLRHFDESVRGVYGPQQ